MNITGKMLLNSAETILKQQRNRASVETASAAASSQADAIPEIQADRLGSRILELSDKLKKTQADYSREQMRFSYAEKGQVDAAIRYENEVLFPEQNGASAPELLETIRSNMNALLHTLRSVQIEMENLYAANPMALSSIDLKNLPESALKELDPARVARLTR